MSAAGIGVPGGTITSVTSGSSRNGSRSSKLAIRGVIGQAIVTPRARPAVGRSRITASSLGRRTASGSQGTTPYPLHPLRASIARYPSSNSAGSPRNLLIRKPDIIAASAGSITERVPTIAAITPPRSMSPTRMTGTSAVRANPILAMSPARRLISAGLPAPSTTTRSQRAESRSKLSRTSTSNPSRPSRQRAAASVPRTVPRTMSCDVRSPCGFSSTGFMSTPGSTRQAIAWVACARPISPPSAVTAALLDMFCGLNGRTESPRLA